MIDADARQWIVDRFGVSRETLLASLAEIVRIGASQQNLIAPSTLDSLWSRHIMDSAQLLTLSGGIEGLWLDIGTGAGFPGLVIACLRPAPMLLCEPRKRRAQFLEAAAARLGLSHVRVVAAKVESLSLPQAASVISARAVSSLTGLLASAEHVSARDTLWLLPKGRGAREEVAEARKTWQGSFHVEQSLTQPDSLIVTARGMARK